MYLHKHVENIRNLPNSLLHRKYASECRLYGREPEEPTAAIHMLTRSSHALAVSSSFKHILHSLLVPARSMACMESLAPTKSVLPAGAVAQLCVPRLLVVQLNVLLNLTTMKWMILGLRLQSHGLR